MSDVPFQLVFPGGDFNQIAQSVHDYFTAEGYKVEAGQPGNATYGVGSDVMHMFFGAFVKRYKFHVAVQVDPQASVILTVSKAMTGMMGGLLGMSKLNKEAQRVFAALNARFVTGR